MMADVVAADLIISLSVAACADANRFNPFPSAIKDAGQVAFIDSSSKKDVQKTVCVLGLVRLCASVRLWRL